MSVTMLDTSWTPAERQATARDAYRTSGYRLSGAELGRRFGRSGRWGRAQIQAVATEDRAASAGSRGREGESPVAAADGTVRSAPTVAAFEGESAAAAPRPMAATWAATAAAGNADAPGSPSVAATGSTATGDPGPVAATGRGSAARHAGATAAAAVSGSSARAGAGTGSAPNGRRTLAVATASDAAKPEVPAAVRWASAGAVVSVAFVAAVASYTHMLDLARHAGEGRLALLLPISVDGLVVAGSTTMVVRRRHGRGGGWLAWLAVSLGIGASLAANVVAADPDLVDPDVVRRVIAGWPPVALAISAELAIELRSGATHRTKRE